MSILDRCESRRGAQVIWLAVHSTEGDGTATALRDAAWWTGSSHAITDNDPGSLLTPAQGCVPYEMAAWTIRGGNHYSDNIEQVGWARWSRADWLARPRLLDNTARWLADRHRARPWIPLTKIGPADVAARRPGVIGHVDYTLGARDGTHTDPGPGYPWDVVIAKARAYAAGAAPAPAPALLALEDDMRVLRDPNGTIWIYTPTDLLPLSDATLSTAAQKLAGGIVDVTAAEFAALSADATARARRQLGDVNQWVWENSPPTRGGPWPIDRLAGIDDKTGAIGTVVASLAHGSGSVAAPADFDALADKIADKLAARLAS